MKERSYVSVPRSRNGTKRSASCLDRLGMMDSRGYSPASAAAPIRATHHGDGVECQGPSRRAGPSGSLSRQQSRLTRLQSHIYRGMCRDSHTFRYIEHLILCAHSVLIKRILDVGAGGLTCKIFCGGITRSRPWIPAPIRWSGRAHYAI